MSTGEPGMTPSTADTSPGNELAGDTWLDAFFQHYYARRPVNATFIGVHDHDHVLPDLSSGGTAETVNEMRRLRRDLEAIPVAGLTDAQRHDRLLAGNFLDLQIMEAGLPQFGRGNPAVATGEGVFSLLSLFLRDSEPLAERVAAAISRMRAMPGFLASGRATTTAAPSPWTDRAIHEARSAVIYFGDGMHQLATDQHITDPAFLEAAVIARDAFAGHADWLENELRHHPSEHIACGRDAFDRYLALGHCLPPEQDAAWVESYARRVMEETRAALDEQARTIDPNQSWTELLATLPDAHPSQTDYYTAFAQVWDASRETALAHDLLSWPDAPIVYGPVPRSDRAAAEGLYYLPYRCPAPFGRPEVHRYLVPPVEPEMPPVEQERRLRVTNDAAIKLNHVVHHGGIGHHVQNWHAARAASRIGQMAGVDCASRIAMFSGGTLVEGWACYATDLMDEAGFLTPLESLSERQGRLRMAARAVADVSLHTGVFTLDETAAFYEREAGMTAAASLGEAVKNSMFPGAAMMYLIGTDAIHDLRGELSHRDGAAFSLRDFHDRFLSYGAIPVSLIAAAMRGQPLGAG